MGIMPFENDAGVPQSIPACPTWCNGGHGEEDGGADADGLHHYGAGPELRFDDICNSVGGHLLRRGGYRIGSALVRCDQWNGRNGITVAEIDLSVLRLSEGQLTEARACVELTGAELRSVAAALLNVADRAEGLR